MPSKAKTSRSNDFTVMSYLRGTAMDVPQAGTFRTLCAPLTSAHPNGVLKILSFFHGAILLFSWFGKWKPAKAKQASKQAMRFGEQNGTASGLGFRISHFSCISNLGGLRVPSQNYSSITLEGLDGHDCLSCFLMDDGRLQPHSRHRSWAG